MLTRTGASAGLVAIAATAGTLLSSSPASAQTTPAAARTDVTRVTAGATAVRGRGGDLWSSPYDHRQRPCHGSCRHRSASDIDDTGDIGADFGVSRSLHAISSDSSAGGMGGTGHGSTRS